MPALHTIAAKAITLRPVLARFAQAGFGCEVASPGELELALAAGFPAERIVFDSPAKTTTEIERALALGVSFNIDNFEELARVDQAIARVEGHRSVIGMRLNPQTGAGTIGAMSTATTTSKFGIGLADHRDEIVDAFADRPWLTQLHVHSGSQGHEPRARRRGRAAGGRARRRDHRTGRRPADSADRHRRRIAGQLRIRRHHPKLRRSPRRAGGCGAATASTARTPW